MAKKIDGYIKLQIAAGQANPSPPVGPALGQKGVNIMEFCKAFNAATQKLEAGMPIPVTITVFQDKSAVPPLEISTFHKFQVLQFGGLVLLLRQFCVPRKQRQ